MSTLRTLLARSRLAITVFREFNVSVNLSTILTTPANGEIQDAVMAGMETCSVLGHSPAAQVSELFTTAMYFQWNLSLSAFGIRPEFEIRLVIRIAKVVFQQKEYMTALIHEISLRYETSALQSMQ